MSKVDYKIGCTKSVFIWDMLRIMILFWKMKITIIQFIVWNNHLTI